MLQLNFPILYAKLGTSVDSCINIQGKNFQEETGNQSDAYMPKEKTTLLKQDLPEVLVFYSLMYFSVCYAYCVSDSFLDCLF